MLPEKSWKVEAILRLFARVVICFLMGAVVSSALDFCLKSFGAQGTVVYLLLTGGALGLFAGALVALGGWWRLETVARKSAILLVCFYGGLLLTWWAGRWRPLPIGPGRTALDMLIAVLSFQGAALLLVHLFLREHRTGWAAAFGFRLERKRALLLGLAFALLFVPLGWGLQEAAGLVLQLFRIQPELQRAVEVLRTTHAWTSRLLLGVAAILIAPTAEEVLFRGILYPAIKQRGFPRLAWWGTALLFGFVHFNLLAFVPLTVLALCLIWLYEKTGNLLAPIAAHTLFNAMNFAALFLGEALRHTPVKP